MQQRSKDLFKSLFSRFGTENTQCDWSRHTSKSRSYPRQTDPCHKEACRGINANFQGQFQYKWRQPRMKFGISGWTTCQVPTPFLARRHCSDLIHATSLFGGVGHSGGIHIEANAWSISNLGLQLNLCADLNQVVGVHFEKIGGSRGVLHHPNK